MKMVLTMTTQDYVRYVAAAVSSGHISGGSVLSGLRSWIQEAMYAYASSSVRDCLDVSHAGLQVEEMPCPGGGRGEEGDSARRTAPSA